MALPNISLINLTNKIYKTPESGSLLYAYAPFKNLKKKDIISGDTDLFNLRLSSTLANINTESPVSLDAEVSYDGSVNLLVNDHKNPIKVVNSRFYLDSSGTYKIADRKGNLDTNIYSEDNFRIETGLVKTVRSIVTLDFLGLESGGNMAVGSYHFYFKLADADGNESDFISESGKVVCHVGGINQPSSIRGGQQDENSDKIIKFKLNNLDLAYNYINIYYTRHSGDENLDLLKTYKITDKFKIRGLSTEISITGYENHVEIDQAEINIRYTTFDAVKTNANCQNITFVGNITNDFEIFKTLEKYSLFITPELSYDKTIGNLNYNFTETYPDEGYEYFNVKNIYYKLGYWEDIYRFGIVYILNDFTLSPVFNIRGIKELNSTTTFATYRKDDTLNYGEDFTLEKYYDKNYLENVKGVFRIRDDSKTDAIFNGEGSIKPLGIKFNFTNVVDSDIYGTGLRDLTKGFFIVRQKRIPTLLTQALAIATGETSYTPLINGTFVSNNKVSYKYFSESFLQNKGTILNPIPRLGRGFFSVNYWKPNAMLCPDADLRTSLYNNYFNSSEFTLQQTSYGNPSKLFTDETPLKTQTIFNIGKMIRLINSEATFPSNLLLVEPGIELINNGDDNKFSSRAGSPIETWKHADLNLGDINDLNIPSVDGDSDRILDNRNPNKWSNSVSKVRGDFGTFIGSSKSLNFGQHYNIYQKDYDVRKWASYFRVRFNDFSSFMPISDRFNWSDIVKHTKVGETGYYINTQYRGDCYINTYAHRMIAGFIDPELPTNTKILDAWTWYKNFKVKTVNMINPDIAGEPIPEFKKVLSLFTYKHGAETDYTGSDTLGDGIIEVDSKKFKKYSEANGIFGSEKINRPDVNAVPIGHWAVFKICSNTNTAMRDTDFSRLEEEAVHKIKRSFYPLQEAKPENKLPDSTVINNGISNSLGDKYYFETPDVPFIKTNFSNRIHYSEILQDSLFKNGNRIFKLQNYEDYTLEYGALVKLVEWYGTLIAIMEHGILMIPVNERAMMTNAQGENVYINTDNVLPKNPKVLSNTFGSVWADSILKTSKHIYGIDTIAKKIWRTDGQKFEIISDLKIQKYLNDNIHLKDTDRSTTVGVNSVKTHFNAFKQDVMFVFKYGTTKWHLCWNELLEKWITRYSWFPDFSENINNIFYTFANKEIYQNKKHILYKHGFAGSEEILGKIEPTKWYDQQQKFEFEFVVIGTQGTQKIFDNLKIISNLAEPESFQFEVVGEGYDWNLQKKLILDLNNPTLTVVDGVTMPIREYQNTEKQWLAKKYKTYLIAKPQVKKIPFIWVRDTNVSTLNWPEDTSVLKDLNIIEHNKTKERLVNSYQKGADIKNGLDYLGKRYGRIKGNMQYVEDFWDIQIQPISFKFAYIKSGELLFSPNSDMKIRDKYLKIRVTYNGTQYAIINALTTFFTISYA